MKVRIPAKRGICFASSGLWCGTGGYRVCGKPRSICEVAGSGQRDVTTLPRV
jgi:hypothetical protein